MGTVALGFCLGSLLMNVVKAQRPNIPNSVNVCYGFACIKIYIECEDRCATWQSAWQIGVS